MSDSIDDCLMANTSPAPENAAPTSAVRTDEQGQHKNGDQNKSRSWTQTSRSNSTSLLTRALAANDEDRRMLNDSPEASTISPQQFAPPPHKSTHNGVTLADHVDPSKDEMAAEVVNMARLISLPVFSSFHLPDSTASNLFTSHREILNGTRGRGTSLERTEKEKRVEDSPKGTYSTNPGDTALPPSPENTSPITLASNNPPVDGVRARYRSWRDVRPGMGSEKAWSIGEQGSDESQGQVEKSIKEAMTGGDSNNRSRKASHSLGFFKEGLPEDKSKKKDAKGRGSFKEALSRGKGVDNGKQRMGQEAPIPESPQYEESDQSRQSPIPSPIDHSSSKVITRINGYGANNSTGLAQQGYFDIAQNVETVTEEGARFLPPQLLSDIRRTHNLTPGADKGTSFSSSLPLTASEKRPSDEGKQELKISARPIDANGDEANHDGADMSFAKTNDEEEEDESGEEQISSAVFLPHHTSHVAIQEGSDESENVTRPRLKDQRRETSGSQQWLEEHRIPTRELEKLYSSQETKPRPLPSQSPSFLDQQVPLISNEAPTSVPENVTAEAADNMHVPSLEEPASLIDALVTTPTGERNRVSSEYNHHQQQDHKLPIDSVELIPYSHQVGGHTTLWRFSKRAVCKQLNNSENKFYEKVERDHPELLKFLPRYIGVLNVTFKRHSRRRSTRKELTEAASERQEIAQVFSSENSTAIADGQISPDGNADQPRLISQSMRSTSVPVPTVSFADNRHIIPRTFMQTIPHLIDPEHRSNSDGVATMSTKSEIQNTFDDSGDVTYRPTLSNKHAVSWGATTVNKQLRNQVFGEAFLREPIPIQRHKKPAAQQRRPLPSRLGGSSLRTSNSESSLKTALESQMPSLQQPEDSMRKKAMKTAAERRNGLAPLTSTGPVQTDDANSDEEAEFDEKAGSSAPEPEIARSPQGKRQRRYSSGGLRRKPAEVADARGNLKYFEEADDAGYKGDAEEDVFPMDDEDSQNPTSPPPALDDSQETSQAPTLQNNELTAARPVTSREASSSLLDIPRPLNPKEAQTQPDSRVEFFLLLEDLTAGMEHPCIMDLKMGTRQYGVEANEKKQLSQQRKCAATTSKALGVRVCGLQVWDKQLQKYIFKDKYFGRELRSGRQFQDALTRFLYDGVDYASVLRHIPAILTKLSKLEVLIKGLPGYRFYAASLLLFYNGQVEEEDGSDGRKKESRISEIDFKIADFANCVTMDDFKFGRRPCPPRHPELPDNGFLRGLASLKRYFIAIQREVYAREKGKMPDDLKNGFDGTASDDLEPREGEISY